MIETLTISGLKRFHEQRISFRPLTVLTGPNGTGKSTILQALKLMRAASQRAGSEAVELNDSGLDLGEAQDILEGATEVSAGIRLVGRVDGVDLPYHFTIPEGRSLRIGIDERPPQAPPALAGAARYFSHLSADRLGPRHTLEAVALNEEELNVGSRGETTAQVLAEFGEKLDVRDELQHPSTSEAGSRATLRPQAELWISALVRPVQLDAQWITGTDVTTLRFRDPGWRGEWLRPSNVGFGLTHALPVVVAGLAAPVGGLMLVENPEAHLHPRAQSAIAGFLARVAASGVQVIVETHSDHVINGVRLAVAARAIPSDGVRICYLGPSTSADGAGASRTEITEIDVRPTGELSTWPEGFFDQIEIDLGMLARSRRRS